MKIKWQFYLFKESCGDAVLTVYRENGADGDIDVRPYHNMKWILILDVQVRYRTIDQSAFAGKDFVGTKDGILSFKSGETTKDILVPIIDDMSATGTDEYFEVTL